MTFHVYFHYTNICQVNRMKNWKYEHEETQREDKFSEIANEPRQAG